MSMACCVAATSGLASGAWNWIVGAVGIDERLGLLLGHRRRDLQHLAAMRRIEQPLHGADMILEEIDERRAVRRDHIGAHRPQHGLDAALAVGAGEQHAVFALVDHVVVVAAPG